MSKRRKYPKPIKVIAKYGEGIWYRCPRCGRVGSSMASYKAHYWKLHIDGKGVKK